MVRQEGGRWDVGAEGNAVYLERISEGDERMFDDLLSPQEARQLAGLLTKYADKADEADESDDKPKDSDDEDSDKDSDDKDSDDKDSDDEESDDEDSEEHNDSDDDKSG